LTVAAVLVAVHVPVSRAANFVMSATDAPGTSSFNSGANWTGGAAPAAGNTYQTSGFLLRTPANSTSIAFAGNSLEIQTGGTLRIKTGGGATVTIADFILDTGATNEISTPTGTAATTMAGAITLNGTPVMDAGIVTDVAGSVFTINSTIGGTGGFTTAGSTGIIVLTGNNDYTGATTVSAGSLVLSGNNTAVTGPMTNNATLQLANVNAVAGSALTLNSGSTLQLRADTQTTFKAASLALANAADTLNFDVNNVTAGVIGQTLSLTNTLTFLDSANQTINVTGASTYTLALGNIVGTTTSHNPYLDLAINAPAGGSSVNIGTFQSGNYSQWLNLQGGGNITITGNLTNVSNGSSIVYVTGGTTATLQGRSSLYSSATPNADAYKYCVANGTLVLDNNHALTNNTSGTGLTQSWFILGAATNAFAVSGSYSAPPGVMVAANNNFNAAVFLGDANFATGGITNNARNTNYVSDGDVGFANSGVFTIGGQNTSGINTYANPIILGLTANHGKSVTLVAATGGEVDFTGNLLANGTDTTAGVTVGDAAHGGVVKFTGANTYAGGTTVTNGTLLVNSATGSGTGTNTVTVGSGGILGGNGVIAGNVLVSGATLPGINGATNTIGGNLTYNPGGVADFYLGTSATGGGNDQIVLNGAGKVLNCGGINVGINCGTNLDTTTDYTLFKLTGSSAGTAGNFNPGPVWLGTVPTNANFYAVVTLANAVVLHYNASGTTNLAAVTNLPASNIGGTYATLNGQLLATGGQYPAVTFYYGTTDGGTNPAAWSASLPLGLQTGIFTAAISNLTGNTTYYFAASVSNSAGVAWGAASKNFTTLPVTPPTVTNYPATSIYSAFATLNGQVLSTGNDTVLVRLYCGTNNGGMNPAAWTNQIFLGAQTGTFSVPVAGLAGNTTYYFSASASNSAGNTWAAPSRSFTTLPLTRIPVLTFHYDNTRQGQNTNETLLTLGNVNVTNFGKLFTYAVDGYVYSQPLIMTNVTVPGQGVHNVVFVATENNTVYAFDADSNSGANSGLLWSKHLGAPVSYTTVGYKPDGDMSPSSIGITGTPVIDPVSGTIYLDTGTYTNGVYTHQIHALNITTGNEQPYSPVLVTASVPGTASDGSGGRVSFIAQDHAARPALTLAGGKLYVSYGSYQDITPYHGWLIGFNATNLVQLTNYVYNTNPNNTQGALWMGGGGLVVDNNTNLYFETANGTFDVNTGGPDYADSFVKLATTNGLAVADYFTPYNQLTLANGDTDLGSGAPLLLPDSAGSATYPHLLVGAGKFGTIYLLNRDSLGHYNGTDGMNGNDSQIVQPVIGAIGGGGSYATPAYFNNRIFYTGKTDNVRAFTITNAAIVTTPQSVSPTQLGAFTGSPVVSANGTSNGIVWVTDPGAYGSSGAAVLHAYNATNLALELYNSSQNPTRDNPGGAVKMTTLVVAGGKVYVGAEYALSVFGPAIFLAAPVISPAGGAFTNSVTVALSDSTAGVSIYYTLDGTTPGAGSTLYSGPFLLTSNAPVQAIALSPGAVNSAVTGASFINMAAAGSGSGLLGQYWTNTTSLAFTNVSFNTPATLVRTDSVVNFNWGTTGPDPVIGGANFTARWTGTVQAQFNELYTFTTLAEDGVRLYVNGQLLINGWGDNPAAVTNSGSLALTAQQLYNIELDYYQKSNPASVALSWSSPSTPPAIVPQTQLYPYTNPPPAVVLTAPAGSATNFTAAASVTVSADADSAYNPLSSVSFYTNGLFLGSVSNVPYTLTVTGLGAGNYAVTAVAVDGSGLAATSAPVNITVAPGSGLAYGLTSNATVNAFLNMPTTYAGALPALLSGTGAFADTPNRIPAGGLIPYLPNTPLWSDGAIKSRYLALPQNGGLVPPARQIGFASTGQWTFPSGTVFVKNFDLVVNQTNASVPLRRLETRLLVRDINGMVYGVTYKWRPDNSDADLLTGSLTEAVLITNATGVVTQNWYYPSPADCLTCHTAVAGYVLGVNARQLNGPNTYPVTGVTDNQLRTLNRLGLFNPAFDEAAIAGFEQLSSITNPAASLEQRARSYLDANCSQCHQPGGTGITFDARYDTPLTNQNIINAAATFSLGYDNARVVAPSDIWRSVLYDRMDVVNPTIQMPPLARNLVDSNAVSVMAAWINSLGGTPALPPPTLAPSGGTFAGSVSVTAQDPATNPTTLYYTLDGTLPTTNSTLYTGPILVTNSATLNINAWAPGYVNSVVDAAQFAILPAFYFNSSLGFSNGMFQMSFTGTVGSNYVLQVSTNLLQWTPLNTNLAVTNQFILQDPLATNFPSRYYRVLQQ
jgi:autotransporter-associated beta strand protein